MREKYPLSLNKVRLEPINRNVFSEMSVHRQGRLTDDRFPKIAATIGFYSSVFILFQTRPLILSEFSFPQTYGYKQEGPTTLQRDPSGSMPI